MKAGFLDREPDPGSLLSGLDPRAKLIAALIATAAVASPPPGSYSPFPWFAALIVAWTLAGRVSPRYLGLRIAAATPFIALAAVAPALGAALGDSSIESAPEALAGSIMLRAWASVALISVLTATTQAADLLSASRRLRFPEAVSAILTLSYRYLFLLSDEGRRIRQAQDCRAAGSLRVPRIPLLAKQVGLVFIRGWERADRVQAAMTLRGFHGRLPTRASGRLGLAELVFMALVTGGFAGVRLLA